MRGFRNGNQVRATRSRLLALYFEQGQFDRAEPMFKRALAIAERSLGSQHSMVALLSENYAQLLRKTGRDEAAAVLAARAAEIRSKSAGN